MAFDSRLSCAQCSVKKFGEDFPVLQPSTHLAYLHINPPDFNTILADPTTNPPDHESWPKPAEFSLRKKYLGGLDRTVFDESNIWGGGGHFLDKPSFCVIAPSPWAGVRGVRGSIPAWSGLGRAGLMRCWYLVWVTVDDEEETRQGGRLSGFGCG